MEVVIDSYERELERYGSLNINNSESLFTTDSTLILQILSNAEVKGDHLLQCAILGVHLLVESFDLSLTEKNEFFSYLSYGFREEFSANSTAAKKQLGEKYRNYRSMLWQVVPGPPKDPFLKEILPLYQGWQNSMKESIRKIAGLKEKRQLEIDPYDLLASYIHMHLNRLFDNNQRLSEMVVYDLLNQHYRSLAAIKKSNKMHLQI
ncbi:Lanthionine biosynthesis protein LanB [Fulvivirga imtechensis AK7]|uniref:Lanthionine biosynthesis protein LanB n=1 Tax=Fulvivirga imtechensis AK7 TaxID=1237149 RepID=L8JZP5_9BACT|nr:thiopeptide-type bacteriocin biosynthesis protein [Fulvivirga imtechensis]ELR73139.1 Lanthionine biosynthesis protein LanB [Fulvivirga imtechensis AK7]